MYPRLFDRIAMNMCELCDGDSLLVGVPTGAIALAAVIAHKRGIRSALYRATAKKHGTRRKFEISGGSHNITLIEDVITTGASVAVVAEDLTRLGHNITRIIAVFNRGTDHITICGKSIPVCSLYRTDDLQLKPRNTGNCIDLPNNIIYACDHNNINDLNLVAPYICGIKIHGDILGARMLAYVYALARKHGFRVIDDHKLADIGAINRKKIVRAADMVTAYAFSLDAVNAIGCDVLLIHSLSIANLGAEYESRCLHIAAKSPYVTGLITQRRIAKFTCFTPGIMFTRLNNTGDEFGQQYRYYRDVDTDYYIAGRRLLSYVKSRKHNL